MEEQIIEVQAAAANALFTTNNLWMMIATALVFIMHLGFSTLEIGFVRSKNVVNVLFKNVMILPIGLLTYYICGFNLMYPGFEGLATDWFGFGGFGISLPEGPSIEYYNGWYTYWTDFLFQAMFAATCATIVSGAVAERVKLGPFLIFSVIFVALVYPILGSWKWGNGWLAAKGFHDFAGSTLVHSVGGWGALAGIMVLGPRIGKFVNGKIKPIPGHSMPMAAIGVFLLFFGWFGFNGGSVLSADPDLVSLVLVTTALAAAAGSVTSMITAKIMFKTYDLSMVFNGILGGLVGITAGADVVSPMSAIIIGAIAGVLIPLAVSMFDKLKLDDPVGATSVHLVCGVWGTLAVGIFAPDKSLAVQALGVAAYAIGAFVPAMVIFLGLKYTVGIRVSREHELEGLDLAEHGMEAYPNFMVTPADGTNS
jgi:Amt family ammonium transporter